MYIYTYMYVYIYIYIDRYMYIYMYIYRERESERKGSTSHRRHRECLRLPRIVRFIDEGFGPSVGCRVSRLRPVETKAPASGRSLSPGR